MPVNGIVGANYLLTRIDNSYEYEDCVRAVVINLIRNCDGGDPNYRTAGCTELWNSYSKYNVGNKYRHIVECMTIDEAKKSGLLIGDLPVIYNSQTGKCEHIAYYMGGIGGYECIHSSKSKGKVCGTTLKNGFTHVLRHRDIMGVRKDSENQSTIDNSIDNIEEGVNMNGLYYAKVATNGGALNLRSSAKIADNIICEIPFGSELIVVEDTAKDWVKVEYNETFGYVSKQYIAYHKGIEENAIEETDNDPVVEQTSSLFNGTWGMFVPCDNKMAANVLQKYFSHGRVIKVKLND